MKIFTRAFAALSLALVLSACAGMLRNPDIADVKQQRRALFRPHRDARRHGHELVGCPARALQDVQSRRWHRRNHRPVARRKPHAVEGSHVKVKGVVRDVAVFNGMPLGLHLEETRPGYPRGTRDRYIRFSLRVIFTATAVMSSARGAVVAECLHRLEDPVHDRLRGLIGQSIDHLDQADGAELVAEVIFRLVNAVGAEHIEVAGLQIERQLLICRARETIRAAHPAAESAPTTPSLRLIGYGRPELAITSWRFLKSNDGVAEHAEIFLELPLVQNRVHRREHARRARPDRREPPPERARAHQLAGKRAV